MRVLFILSDNIYLTPYFNFYKELLKKLLIMMLYIGIKILMRLLQNKTIIVFLFLVREN